ncbi:MAG: DUF5411 family protein [Bacilli bacterium]|jgi:hypothetical protein|nr:DUF5411 family protein [Clostridium sp.]MDY3798462.1 DUF5411 family protein [Bacilli bacterium]CDE95280.1 unknown [Clostridium sp. CAG:914]
MKWSFSALGLIVMGLFGFMILMLFSEITISNEQDYYSIKEVTESAMIESIDIAYYRLTGKIKISREKFVENFSKRFVKNSTYGDGNYDIIFYSIREDPPKVSIGIIDSTQTYNIYTETLDPTRIDVVNKITAILDSYE